MLAATIASHAGGSAAIAASTPASLAPWIAEQLRELALEGRAPSEAAAEVVDGDDVALLGGPDGRGLLVLSGEAVRATVAPRDLGVLLELRMIQAHRPPHRSGRVARFVAGLAGLYGSEAVNGRQRIDRDLPVPAPYVSDLDNPPTGLDERAESRLSVRRSFAASGCEAGFVSLMVRIREGGRERRTAAWRDATFVLNSLGSLAYSPDPRCPDAQDRGGYLTSLRLQFAAVSPAG